MTIKDKTLNVEKHRLDRILENDEIRAMIKQITIEDAAEADKVFSILMGDEVQPRREFISNNANDADFVDI